MNEPLKQRVVTLSVLVAGTADESVVVDLQAEHNRLLSRYGDQIEYASVSISTVDPEAEEAVDRVHVAEGGMAFWKDGDEPGGREAVQE